MENKNWSIHFEFVILLVTLLGGFYTLDSKIESQIQKQSDRSDKLYEMFYDLIKETRSK